MSELKARFHLPDFTHHAKMKNMPEYRDEARFMFLHNLERNGIG